LPRKTGTLIISNLSPDESIHVKLVNGVQFFLVKRSSSEQQQRILMLVVVECEVGAGRWQFSLLMDSLEAEGGEIEPPEVVIVLRI
jgi:hypothetical protein